MAKEQIGLVDTDADEITTSGASVTGKHLLADGGDGKEKEANTLDPVAGASSTAPAGSGIPSAMTQQGIAAGRDVDERTASRSETPMADRTIAKHQDVKP